MFINALKRLVSYIIYIFYALFVFLLTFNGSFYEMLFKSMGFLIPTRKQNTRSHFLIDPDLD